MISLTQKKLQNFFHFFYCFIVIDIHRPCMLSGRMLLDPRWCNGRYLIKYLSSKRELV
jgi:hypothetical protein